MSGKKPDSAAAAQTLDALRVLTSWATGPWRREIRNPFLAGPVRRALQVIGDADEHTCHWTEVLGLRGESQVRDDDADRAKAFERLPQPPE